MQDLINLKHRAIQIDPNVGVILRKTPPSTPTPYFEAQSGTYISNPELIVFSFNGKLYLTPYSMRIITLLWNNNFRRSSNYGINPSWKNPFKITSTWVELQDAAHCSKIKNFEKDCISFSERNKIKKIPEEILAHAIEVPSKGLKVGQKMYYPVFQTTILDKETLPKIGKFVNTEGITIFVYRNGKTFLSSNIDLPGVLPFYGYSQANWLMN